jgi:hypothetical protein
MVELERVESLPQKVLSRYLFMNMESTVRILIGKESGETIFLHTFEWNEINSSEWIFKLNNNKKERHNTVNETNKKDK